MSERISFEICVNININVNVNIKYGVSFDYNNKRRTMWKILKSLYILYLKSTKIKNITRHRWWEFKGTKMTVRPISKTVKSQDIEDEMYSNIFM